MQRKKLSGSIVKRLILYIVLVSSFITLFTTAIQLYFDYRTDVNLIQTNMEQIDKVYYSSIVNTVWKVDKQNAELLLNGLLQLRDMQYIALYDDNGLWVELGDKQKQRVLVHETQLTQLYRGEQRNIGKFIAIASLTEVYERLLNTLWIVLIANGIKTFLVASAMLLIFRQLITRHLHALATNVEALDLSTMAEPLSIDKISTVNKEDEIDIVVHAIQHMQLNLVRSLDEIQERDIRLSMYEKIISTTPDLMAFVDLNYTFLAVNNAYTKTFDIPAEEMIGVHMRNVLGEEYFDTSLQPMLEKVFAGETLHFRTIIKRTIPLEVSFVPYYDEHKTVQGAVVHARNISERVEYEKAQTRHASIYQALARNPATDFEHSLQEFCTLLAETFNARFVLVSRLIPESKCIQTITQLENKKFINNASYSLTNTACETILTNKKALIIDKKIREQFPDDDLLLQHDAQSCLGAPLLDDQENIIGFLLVLDDKPLDVHDWYEETLVVFAVRIAVEMQRADILQELKQHRVNLEIEVQNRTAELQVANDELKSFAYTVSHDLRTPLRTINGYASALIEDCGDSLDEVATTYLSRIRAASIRMGELIDSLLTLSRISRHEVARATINLSQLVQHIINEMQITNPPSITIEDNLALHADPVLCRTMLENLFSNAVKFSHKKSNPQIEFGKVSDTQSQYSGYLFIRDNGAGFDSRYKDKLYQPFQRLHTNNEFEGTGIGLATVSRIVQMHGGKISIESKLDVGATVYFYL